MVKDYSNSEGGGICTCHFMCYNFFNHIFFFNFKMWLLRYEVLKFNAVLLCVCVCGGGGGGIQNIETCI